MPHDHYQTVKEVADRLKVAEATVRHWIKTCDLRAVDIGKGWRIADADLAQFIQRHETAPRLQSGGHEGPVREGKT
jgi:excisionase family DNA binding protein